MKKALLIIGSLFLSYVVQAQGIQITAGYIPDQATSVNPKGDAIIFDILGWNFMGNTGPLLVGFGGGLGISSFRKLPNESFLNTDDPYKTSATRFNVHLGPGIGLRLNDAVAFVLSPQFGLWYAGMSDDGPKMNFVTSANMDLIFANVFSVGLTYNFSSPRLVSTNWNVYTPENKYILVKPSLGFRISMFVIAFDSD